MVTILLMMCTMFGTCDQPQMNRIDSGWSTWYGDGNFHGNITANGEVFDPNKQTCAHRRIRLGTVIWIKSQKTGDWTWCRVNDRGPYGAKMPSGEWVIMYPRGGRWWTKHLDGSLQSWDKRPAKYRGVLDMSLATARSLYKTDERPPNGYVDIYR